MPLRFGDRAVFFHRSHASRVEWRGDFTAWESVPEAQGRRLGHTDIWTMRRRFPADARLDYKIVESSETWLVDPLNPRRQLGGYGPNSVDVGAFDDCPLDQARALRSAYERHGVAVSYLEPADGHSWGHWRATAAEILEHLFGPPPAG